MVKLKQRLNKLKIYLSLIPLKWFYASKFNKMHHYVNDAGFSVHYGSSAGETR